MGFINVSPTSITVNPSSEVTTDVGDDSKVIVDTTIGGTVIVAANSNRVSIVLQNIGEENCYLSLKGDPVIDTNTNLLLFAGGASVAVTDKVEIKGITAANSTIILITETVTI